MRTITSQGLLAWLGAVLLLGLVTLQGSSCTGDTSTALGATEICDNDADDDGDGLVDCLDPDCDGHLACDPQYREFLCDNDADDDGDGATDCDDPDCADRQVCNPDREVDCIDGLDNDGDGLADCRDPDCAETADCLEHCSDGLDNDGDGLIDCQDPDCAVKPECRYEICDNGEDDDGDELVDCEDSDCAETAACITPPALEHCSDGLDNDGDGLADCADPDCEANPLCREVFCYDGWDNDQDGAVDCEDQDCQATPACQTNATCQGAMMLSCGIDVSGTTRGRVSSFSTDPCTQNGSLAGGERLYQFTNTGNTSVTLQLTIVPEDPGVEFVLLTFHGTASGCTQTTTCLPSMSRTALSVKLYVGPGQTVYAVVDSAQQHGGEFLLQVRCPDSYTEICNNGTDDDGDQKVDCWDLDCLGQAGCTHWVSAGVGCNPIEPFTCAPGEQCLPVTIANVSTSMGICTKTCYHPGMPGTDCYNPEFPYGECVATALPESTCVMRCGSQYPSNPQCPAGTICTNPSNGSIGTVQNGICAPL